MMEHRYNCMICGGEIEYHAEMREFTCALCGGAFSSNASCKQGHFVCDVCHGESAIDLIVKVCAASPEKNPIEIMLRLMEHPNVHMHGPEHHVMVGAAILAAYKNSGGKLELDSALLEMKRRGSQVPGGICGLWGCCGAAVSAGIAVSIITGSTPLKREEWRLSNLMTSRALLAIANAGGPRCCKRDGFIAAVEAAEFIAENLGVQLELPPEIICRFSHLNKECLGIDCWFNRHSE